MINVSLTSLATIEETGDSVTPCPDCLFQSARDIYTQLQSLKYPEITGPAVPQDHHLRGISV